MPKSETTVIWYYSALCPNALRYPSFQPSDLPQKPERKPSRLVVFTDDDLAQALLTPVGQVGVVDVVMGITAANGLIGRVDEPSCRLVRDASVVHVTYTPMPYSPEVIGDPLFFPEPTLR